jgi:DNA-binding transcriptional LysR family regulator
MIKSVTISWRHIEFFNGVMTTGSMTQAAAMLRTSQPTVSRELKELERLLGFSLFERRERRLFATEQALSFHAEVKRSFLGLEHLAQAAQAIKGNTTDGIQVACLPLFAQTLMPRVCERFLDQEPAARLSVEVVDQSILLRELLALRYQFGVVEAGVAVEGTTLQDVPMGEEVVVLPAGHRLCGRRQIRPSDLAGENFISFAAEDLYRRRFDKIFEQAGIVRLLRMETTTAEAVCALVERGIGVSIVNPITAYAYRGRGVEIRRLSIAIPFVVGLCRPLGHRPSKLGERFAACVLDECRKLRLETRHAIGGRRAR